MSNNMDDYLKVYTRLILSFNVRVNDTLENIVTRKHSR